MGEETDRQGGREVRIRGSRPERERERENSKKERKEKKRRRRKEGKERLRINREGQRESREIHSFM